MRILTIGEEERALMIDRRLVGRNYRDHDRIDKIDLNGEKIFAQLRGWPWGPAIR